MFYFDFGKQEESHDFVNVLLQRKDLNTLPDIASFARILQIINLMELKSDDVLSYFIRSAPRYMSTHKQLFEVEKIFLKYLKSMAAGRDEARFLKVLAACKKELEPFVNIPYEQNAFQYFDFITWIESKLEKIPFAQMIQKKFNSRRVSANILERRCGTLRRAEDIAEG